jgi:hypothetical protein
MSAGAVLARVVQQPHPNFFPNGMWPIEFQSIGLLNLDGAKAAQAFDAKQVPGNFG